MIVLVVGNDSVGRLKNELHRAGHTVVGPASNASDAMTYAREHKPQLALIDIALDGRPAAISLARDLASLDTFSIFTGGDRPRRSKRQARGWNLWRALAGQVKSRRLAS